MNDALLVLEQSLAERSLKFLDSKRNLVYMIALSA